MSDDYANPTLAQRAHADQMLAASSARLARIFDRVRRGDLEPGHDRTVSISLAVTDELDSLGDDQLLEAVAILAVMIARATQVGGGQ